MFKALTFAIALSLTGLATWSPVSFAQSNGATLWQGFGPSSSNGRARQQANGNAGAAAEQDGISAGEAAAIVRRTGAKVLDVRRVDGAYKVKTLTPNGRIRMVWVDAQSGRVSR